MTEAQHTDRADDAGLSAERLLKDAQAIFDAGADEVSMPREDLACLMRLAARTAALTTPAGGADGGGGREALREALEPFARVSAEIGARGKDDECWCGQNGAVIRYGDLRRAAALASRTLALGAAGVAGEEVVARAIDPMAWEWLDRTETTHKAYASTREHQLSQARRALAAARGDGK